MNANTKRLKKLNFRNKLGILVIIFIIISSYWLGHSRILNLNTSSKSLPEDKISTLSKNTPTPTINPNPMVDCPIVSQCGGGSQNITKSECTDTTCCETKKDQWQIMTKEACEVVKNQSPSGQALVLATKTFVYLKASGNSNFQNYTQDQVNNFAKALDWDPAAMSQAEIAIAEIEAFNQARSQNQYYAPPQIQIPQIQMPQFHMYTTNCTASPFGGTFTCFTQ